MFPLQKVWYGYVNSIVQLSNPQRSSLLSENFHFAKLERAAELL